MNCLVNIFSIKNALMNGFQDIILAQYAEKAFEYYLLFFILKFKILFVII